MGKFSDKFLNMLRVEEDYDDDFEDFDNPYNDEEEVNKKKEAKAAKKAEKLQKIENERYEEPQPVQQQAKPAFNKKQQSKVVPISRGQQQNMEVCVIKPSTVDDARDITDTLLNGKAVVLNLEGIHVDVAQRIIDFASGSCYSMNGNLQKISNYIFIITPESVDISGDFPEMLAGGFDVATFK